MSRLIRMFIFLFCLVFLGMILFAGWSLGVNSKINNIELTIGNDLDPKSDIGLQAYIDKFDIQSNWFILYVTLLFGVFGIFGYTFVVKIVDGKIKDIERQTKRNNKSQDEKYKGYYEKHDDEFIKLKNEFLDNKKILYNGLGILHSIVAGEALERDIVTCLLNSVRCARFFKLKYDIDGMDLGFLQSALDATGNALTIFEHKAKKMISEGNPLDEEEEAMIFESSFHLKEILSVTDKKIYDSCISAIDRLRRIEAQFSV